MGFSVEHQDLLLNSIFSDVLDGQPKQQFQTELRFQEVTQEYKVSAIT